MKFLKDFLLFWGCLTCVHCYFYPLCSSDDDSCTGYFKLPDSLEFLFTYTPQIEYKPERVKDTRVMVFHGFTDTVMDNFFYVLAPVTDFYVKNLVPFLKQIKTAVKNSYTTTLKYLPDMFKEKEKVKSSSNRYIFFIVGSLALYLLLYVYFTRKLYFYYKSSLRLEYLNKVKKIFKVKEKE